MPTIDPDEFKAKVERILSSMYGGLHHLPNKIKFTLGQDFQMAEINIYGDLATFDFGRLTWLVLGAHDECVRVEVNACNTQYLKLRLHPRLREGGTFQRHPTIEEAIALFRRAKEA